MVSWLYYIPIKSPWHSPYCLDISSYRTGYLRGQTLESELMENEESYFFLLSWFYMVRNSHETPYKTHVLLGISPLIVGYIIIPILLSVYPILINGNSRILKWRNCTIQAYIYMYLTCGKCLQFSLLTLTNMEKYTMILKNSSQD